MLTNWGNIYAVVRREFLDRVRKKSFLITTLITPVVFGSLMILPGVLSVMQTGKPTEVLVVDRTGWAGAAVVAADPAPRNTGTSMEDAAEKNAMKSATLKMAPADQDLEAIKRDIGDGKVDGALLLESDDKTELKATYLSQNISNPQLFQLLNSRLNVVLVAHRLDTLGLDRAIADKLKGRVDVDPVKVEKGGKTRKGSIMDFLVPIALALVIYMMILMYGNAIMNGVLEEKNSKVVEVILSAVRPFELMMGKIVGIAAVGLLQYGIWFVAGTVIFMANPMNFQAPDGRVPGQAPPAGSPRPLLPPGLHLLLEPLRGHRRRLHHPAGDPAVAVARRLRAHHPLHARDAHPHDAQCAVGRGAQPLPRDLAHHHAPAGGCGAGAPLADRGEPRAARRGHRRRGLGCGEGLPRRHPHDGQAAEHPGDSEMDRGEMMEREKGRRGEGERLSSPALALSRSPVRSDRGTVRRDR